MDSLLFWIFACAAVGAGVNAVFNKSAIYGALSLIVVFMSIAGFFVLNNADFLAIAQIIIYAVGLTIIMLFAIMLTGDKPMQSVPTDAKGHLDSVRLRIFKMSRLAYGIIIAYVLVLLLRGVSQPTVFTASVAFTAQTQALINKITTQGTASVLSDILFRQATLPFELASILLLAATVGAIVIAKKRFEHQAVDDSVRLPLDTASAPSQDAVEALRRERGLVSIGKES